MPAYRLSCRRQLAEFPSAAWPLLLLLLSLSVAGCGSDDISPPPLPTEGFPETPDQLMTNFKLAYTQMDSLAYQQLLRRDYRFLFAESDVIDLGLVSDHLLYGEEVVSALNMFSGQAVANYFGGVEAGISAMNIEVLAPVDGWEEAAPTSPFPGAGRRLYDVQMSIERPGNSTIVISGQQEFFVTSRDSAVSAEVTKPFYQLLGQRDATATGKDAPGMSWGRVKRSYLTNMPPVAAFIHSFDSDSADPTFYGDASPSYDPDSGLDAEPYRWRFTYLGDWTEWSSDPTVVHPFTDGPGEKAVTLQVRDRWGGYGIEGITYLVDRIFPDTADKLMADFRFAYDNRNLPAYMATLRDDYRFIFHPIDVVQLGLPENYLTREEEYEISFHLFGGGGPVPVSDIAIDVFEPQTTWTVSANPDFPDTYRRVYLVALSVMRPGSTTILIEGLQEFFAGRSDSVTNDGATRPYWELVGQADLTPAGRAKRVESSSWGALKWLYR